MTRSTSIRLLVHGASGRMGRAVLRLARDDGRFTVVAAASRGGEAVEGAPGLAASALEAAPDFDLAIDFSLPEGFDAILSLCLDRNAALVSGTTGLSAVQQARLDQAAGRIATLVAANFSLGVAVLEDLVKRATAALPDWPLSLVETHHVHKLDAPSGTALALARAAQAVNGKAPAIESVREGEVVGIHRLAFAGPGETLELGHVAGDREIFARGALHAATLVVDRGPGAYRLGELLFD
jgi:4-hydroxy-tetrahydrodipicolinate reductase